MLYCLIFCYPIIAKPEPYCISSETECMPLYAPSLGRTELVCYEKCLKYRRTENTSKKRDDDKFHQRWKDLWNDWDKN